MKILLIARGYPSKRKPRWGIFEKDQALALQAVGHKVIYMSVELTYNWRKIGIFHTIENEMEIYRIGFPNFFTRITQKWAYKTRQKLALILYKKIEKEKGKPDILYAHYFYNIAASIEIKKKYGLPLVVIEHWSKLMQKKLPQYMLNVGNLAYNMADRIISVSDSLRQQILHHFNKESLVIHNMVGNEFTTEVVSKERNVESKVKFVSIGSLIPIKGFDILIDAFHKSELKVKGVVINIVGKGAVIGNIENTLQKQIIDAGLSEHIFLVGQKGRKDIIEILKDSDVFVLSSRAETFSVVCIEALCLGLPVIATACGGPENFISEQNGLLVPPNDSEALSVAMQTMYNTFSNYDKKMIAAECRKQFSSSAIANKLTAIFEDVINSKNVFES